MIEASAGTGKTFSVALLVVRLIVEKGIPVGRILMMTFTNAAVAELAERVRLFIRAGLACLEGTDNPNPALKKLLVTGKNEEEKKTARGRLARAMLELDQLSVLTIHSFCSKTISRFSFETGQAMGSEPTDNPDLIVSPLVDDFWRSNVATLKTSVLMRLLEEKKFKKSDLLSAVNEALGGKEYTFNNPEARIEDADIDMVSFERLIESSLDYFRNSIANITNARTRNGYISFLDNNDYAGFAKKLRDAVKDNPNYLAQIPDLVDLFKASEQEIVAVIRTLISLSIKEIVPAVNQAIEEGNLITYNDMIDNMRKALDGDNASVLKRILRAEYDAVFIDEFQDTDRSQFEIFRRAFMENDQGDETEKTVFLIGDPKQMIYAWRKADMETYLAARETVGDGHDDNDENDDDNHENEDNDDHDGVYQMKENFRSSKRMIEAMNLYFKETDVPGIFLMDDAVRYIDVNYPAEPKTKGELLDDARKVPHVPIEISVGDVKRTVKKRMMVQLAGLIGVNAPARIPDPSEPEGNRKVRYSDIGILVRYNKEAREIKALLSKYGIPAIQIDDADIFDSDEAEWMLYLLTAILDRRPDSIRRVMFSSTTGLTYDKVGRMDLDKITAILKNCHDILLSKGIYSAVNTFFEEFRVRQYLVFETPVKGERVYANLVQLIELLHEAESDIRLSPEELVIWLRKKISNSEKSKEKAYELRLESDEDAIKIVTIHKSKGLEYNIVFAPFMNLKIPNNHFFRSYRKNHVHYFVDKHNMGLDQEMSSGREVEQENRRLMYVAVTRAKYKAFLHMNKWGGKDTVIDMFINKIKSQQQDDDVSIWIRDPEYPDQGPAPGTLVSILEYSQKEEANLRYPRKSQFARPAAAMTVPTPRVFAGEPPMDIWRRLSYSAIKSKSTEKGVVREKVEHKEALERFVFSGFPKGAKAGTILHTILEKIDFTETDHSKWDPVIKDVLRFYRLKGDSDVQTLRLREWIHELLETELTINGHTFTLSQLPPSDLIPEFEFDFKLDEFQVADLLDAAGHTPVRVNAALGSLKGIMNGKMDIFFRHEGRYYILDWKTNHLGYTLEDYGADQVRNAMEESNYNLQYLIYSVAARKYLASRMDNFDYERDFGGVIYLFVRGVRKGHETGIYIDRIGVAALDRFENAMSAPA